MITRLSYQKIPPWQYKSFPAAGHAMRKVQLALDTRFVLDSGGDGVHTGRV